MNLTFILRQLSKLSLDEMETKEFINQIIQLTCLLQFLQQ